MPFVVIMRVQIGAPYQEERDDNGDVICGRKFKPEFIDALLNGETGTYLSCGAGRYE